MKVSSIIFGPDGWFDVYDFEVEYCVKEWSRKNGFEFISCEGDGYDDGYEPNFRRGWY